MKKNKNVRRKAKKNTSPFGFLLLIIFALVIFLIYYKREEIPDYIKYIEETALFKAESTREPLAEPEKPSLVHFDKGLEIPLCGAKSHASDHEVRFFKNYSICYRESYEQAEWSAYCLSDFQLEKNASRSNDFRVDPLISTGSANLADYRKSGYDRGHLTPAADMSFSEDAMSETFFMSNMSPQTPELNRGVWKDLEAQVRDWVKTFGRAYVVSGPVLNKKAGEFNSIGENQVAIPEYYYKVVLVPLYEDEADRKSMDDAKAVMAIGFVIPNQGCEDNFWRYAVPVDEVEVLTNLDFFAILEDAEEDKIEAEANPSKWENTY